MTLTVAALVLLAALLHASWNALLKASGDRLWSITVMQIAEMAATAAALPFLPLPAIESWPWLIAGAILHLVYRLTLIEAYAHGDLGQIYPIARGLSPVLTTLGAALIIGEVPGTSALAGIVLVSAGIMAMRGAGAKLALRALILAAATGAMIGSYTVADAIGARRSGNPLAFMAWLFFIGGVITTIAYVARRGVPRAVPAGTAASAISGLVAMFGYGLVIWASTLGPMGQVSALRETSVLLAALIGWFALGETMSWRRALACIAIACGAVLIVR